MAPSSTFFWITLCFFTVTSAQRQNQASVFKREVASDKPPALCVDSGQEFPCADMADGNFDLCDQCELGKFASCSDGNFTLRDCPNAKDIFGHSYNLRFDSITQACSFASKTCSSTGTGGRLKRATAEREGGCVDSTHASPCKGIPDGDYSLCLGCESGTYATCSNEHFYIRPCPQAYGPEGTLTTLLFDDRRKRCDWESAFCSQAGSRTEGPFTNPVLATRETQLAAEFQDTGRRVDLSQHLPCQDFPDGDFPLAGDCRWGSYATCSNEDVIVKKKDRCENEIPFLGNNLSLCRGDNASMCYHHFHRSCGRSSTTSAGLIFDSTLKVCQAESSTCVKNLQRHPNSPAAKSSKGSISCAEVCRKNDRNSDVVRNGAPGNVESDVGNLGGARGVGENGVSSGRSCVDSALALPCQGFADGDYQLCHGCDSGYFIKCSNQNHHVMPCPNAYNSYGDLTKLIFDSSLSTCEWISSTCAA